MSTTATLEIPPKKTAKVVRRQRAYDYLYDPVFTVSSEVDHYRAGLKAQATKDRFRRVAEFKSMFSSLSHHPTYSLQLDSVDPVPAFIGRRWRGPTEQNMVALQQLAGVVPNSQSWLKKEECQIRGTDRWKYFKCPQIPFEQQLSPGGISALPGDDIVSTTVSSDDRPTHVTVGVQTDYRESEAQTDPYSPEYVLQPGATPSELLQLAALTWGSGLPVGLREIEMIQRARAKQAWKATLPPLDDLSQLDKRRKMMEEMEAQDWAFREAEIQKLHEERHAVSVDLLKQRVMSQEKATNQTLNKLYSKIQNEKEKRQQAIHDDYMRSLRKLEAKRQTAKEKILTLEIKHSVANETWLHTDFSTNESAYNDYIKSHYLQEYSGLQKLELGLFKPQVRRPKLKLKTTIDVIHPPVSAKLKTYKALKKEIEQVEEKPLRFLVKKEKPVPRPATPTVHEPPEGEEEEECAIIFIQKLLRGRKVQCEMLQGIEDRMDLIQELQTVHALQEEEQELQDADRDFVLSLKEQRDKARHQTLQEETSEAGAMGAELHHLLDTLSKELIRLQEERRIHALVLLAERDRRLREAEESGRRQVEERRRREEDQIFRQVVQVHQETVDLYLEDIILDTLENTTDQRAREDIHRRAQEVNRLAFAMEESRNRLQSEEIVSELVYSFLIPEIEKMSFRQKVHQRQQRHLQAARDIIQERVEHAGNHPGSLGSSQLSGPSEGASSQDRRISRVDEEQEVK
ncbi:cilia- and flagella-associated protein 91-like [Takifugu rubripes]|uniref:cilia- and flagella-associated protein 91-like n=1 Tax=Takifugu rubripes TaxID=31033 RepID=UPI0011459000|nr:cilia- and flagella-associated protein 91-like [Takifugu rubripes]